MSTQQSFLDAASSGSVSGAYLIVCPRPGVAERVIDAFLMRLYCQQGGCGICAECRMVAHGHVDILRLDAPKVAALRNALSFTQEKAFGDRFKCVVIKNADEMTDAAANSLLKTLEEPPGKTVFILQSKSIVGVLPTVASRCAAVFLLPEPRAVQIISEKLGVDDATARILCDLSGGFVEEAVLFYEDKAFMAARGDVLDICQKLLDQKNMAISQYADFLENHKSHLRPLLCVMASYFRDILYYMKTGNARLIINADRPDSIRNAALHFTSGAISNMISVIFETERRFFFPVNFRLAAEKLFFDILEEKNRWKK